MLDIPRSSYVQNNLPSKGIVFYHTDYSNIGELYTEYCHIDTHGNLDHLIIDLIQTLTTTTVEEVLLRYTQKYHPNQNLSFLSNLCYAIREDFIRTLNNLGTVSYSKLRVVNYTHTRMTCEAIY